MAASSGNEEAGLFLAPRGTDPNHNNKLGETPLHLSARKGLSKLVASLLNKYVISFLKFFRRNKLIGNTNIN